MLGAGADRATATLQGVNASAWKSQGATAENALLQGSPANRRGDDDEITYRLAPACSAELWAASASFAEIEAVSAGVPQLGASLPSPQARGR